MRIDCHLASHTDGIYVDGRPLSQFVSFVEQPGQDECPLTPVKKEGISPGLDQRPVSAERK